jgi:hypothetical protein
VTPLFVVVGGVSRRPGGTAVLSFVVDVLKTNQQQLWMIVTT